jgi:SAM-dependent methyltransferase
MNTPITRRAVLPGSLAALAGALGAQEKPAPGKVVSRYQPSTPKIVKAMLKLAEVKKGDVVYDLGCGDGRVVITAAKDYGATGVGIDIDAELIQRARENARKAGVAGKVEFRQEDLFQADISRATVVALYLQPWVNLKLRPKLLAELKPGTRIVSNLHDMGDWLPEKKTKEIDYHEILLWTVPARRP